MRLQVIDLAVLGGQTLLVFFFPVGVLLFYFLDLSGQNITDGGVVLRTLVFVSHLFRGLPGLSQRLLKFVILEFFEHVLGNLLLYGRHPLLDEPVNFGGFDRNIQPCVALVYVMRLIEGRLPKIQFHGFFFVEFSLTHIKVYLGDLYIMSIFFYSGNKFGLFLFDGPTCVLVKIHDSVDLELFAKRYDIFVGLKFAIFGRELLLTARPHYLNL